MSFFSEEGELTWWWSPSPAPSSGSMVALPRFANRGDAESWIGAHYPELVEAGVDEVTLLDSDREVYGPMSLTQTVVDQ